jgi:hypothetical protein
MSYKEAYDFTQSRSQLIMRYKNRNGERLEVYLTGETILTIFNLDKETISTYNRSIDPSGFDKTLTAFLLANSMIK